jgi:hypothetical protein
LIPAPERPEHTVGRLRCVSPDIIVSETNRLPPRRRQLRDNRVCNIDALLLEFVKGPRIHSRIHRGIYRALPLPRRYIPKQDGRQRPLAIAALEDKIVQRVVVEVLNAIYEEDFLGFSYGFRPGRGQHDALDALAVGITRTPVEASFSSSGRRVEIGCELEQFSTGLRAVPGANLAGGIESARFHRGA